MTVLMAASPLSQPFIEHAFLAGTAIAVACGLVGYFLVLRAQVFTGDTLSHVAFTGAMAALVLGADLRLGLFTATIAMALLFGALGRRARPVARTSGFAEVRHTVELSGVCPDCGTARTSPTNS
jgi:zinc/manganese transport system permease protein